MYAQNNPFVGTWNYSAQNSTIQMKADFTFTASSPQGKSNGTYTWQNNILYFMTPQGQQIMYYTVNGIDANQMHLTDPYGYNVIYNKQQTTQPNNPVTTNTHIPIPWEASKYNVVLANAKGMELKKSHVQVGVALVEFIIGKHIKASEVKELETSSIPEFKSNPQEFMKQINSIAESMKKLYTLSDATQLGTARQELFGALYLAAVHIPTDKQPKLLQIMNRYVKVLTYDAANQLVLTEADVQGMMNYVELQSELLGYTQKISTAEKTAYKQQILVLFSQMSVQQRQYLCSGSLIWDVVKTNWDKMTYQQKQQLKAQYQQQTNQNMPNINMDAFNQSAAKWKKYYEEKYPITEGSGGSGKSSNNTCWECFKIMSNSMTEHHVTMMNMIEGMGGSDNYWKVSYDNW
jgi:hypothetical protein